MNRTLKEKIEKKCIHTGLKCPESLNLGLWDVWNAPRQPLRLTAAKILFGRHLATLGTFIPAKTSLLDR